MCACGIPDGLESPYLCGILERPRKHLAASRMGGPGRSFPTWEVDNAWEMATSTLMITLFCSWAESGLSRCLHRYYNLVAKALMAGPLIGLSSLSVSGFDNGPALTR